MPPMEWSLRCPGDGELRSMPSVKMCVRRRYWLRQGVCRCKNSVFIVQSEAGDDCRWMVDWPSNMIVVVPSELVKAGSYSHFTSDASYFMRVSCTMFSWP